ncbi:hypothetical protein GIB67_012501, partial [Kingdonia uniflora]
ASPLIEQPDVVMMEDDEGPPIWPTSQVKVLHSLIYYSMRVHRLIHLNMGLLPGVDKRVKKPRASEPLEEELDDLPHMHFSNDEPNIESESGVGMGGDTPVNAETENRWAETNPDSLDAEEGYYSNYSSVDGDDGLTQTDIERYDDEFRDLAKECDNIFTTKEAEVHHTTLPMHNPRVNSDGTTFSMRASSNLIHTCPGRSGQSNKNVNAQRVANKVKETIRVVRTTRPAGVKELISRRYGVDISYYTSWNAGTICTERIVGSYDEGYIL